MFPIDSIITIVVANDIKFVFFLLDFYLIGIYGNI